MGRSLLAGILALAVLALPAPSAPRAEDEKPPKVPLSTARANARGNQLVREGKFDEAANTYRDEALKRPENGILQRNLAGALARSGQMDEGLAAYGQALRFSASNAEKAKVLYDLGNSLALAGQMQPALETYAQAMFLAPEDLDIKHNFEYLMKMMQDQQQQEQEQQNQNDSQNQNEGDQSEQEQQSQEQENQAEQTPQPQNSDTPDQQEQPQEMPPPDTESMDPEDAQRLLDALLEEEKELQAERNRQQQLKYKNVEKDW